MFPHTIYFSLFFFFREEQQQVFLRFNVTPSANFLVCSKCVTGDSQQDRNARAYFLVKQENKQKKQRQSNKQNITKHKSNRKDNKKNSKQNYARSKRSDSRVVQIESAHNRRYVFKLLSCLTVIIVDRTFILFFSTVESVMFTEQKKSIHKHKSTS